MRRSFLRWLWSIPILYGCSAAEAARETAAMDERSVAEAAEGQFLAPGTAAFTVPSSFEGAKEWTVYLGAGITAIASDEAKAMKAAVVLVMKDDKVVGFACATIDDAHACREIVHAASRDLAEAEEATSTSRQSLTNVYAVRPAGTPTAQRTASEDEAFCRDGLLLAIDAMKKSIAEGDLAGSSDPNQILCVPDDEQKKVMLGTEDDAPVVPPGHCVSFYAAAEAETNNINMTEGIGSACCRGVPTVEGLPAGAGRTGGRAHQG